MGSRKSVLWAQMLGDRNWLAAKLGSGAAVDRLKLHPHGAVRMPCRIAPLRPLSAEGTIPVVE